MTETRFYEPARLSTPPKPLLSLKPLDANLVDVIVISTMVLVKGAMFMLNSSPAKSVKETGPS